MRAVARDMLRRGFAVFPLSIGSKYPLAKMEGRGWKDLVTRDPDAVDDLWIDAYNVGIDCSDIVVVDADRHNPAIDGVANLFAAGVPLDGMTVATPGHGLHLYFNGPAVQSGVSLLAPGVDIRSHGGYVVAPGCPRFDHDGRFYKIVQDVAPPDLPTDVRDRLRPPVPRTSGPALGEADTPEALAIATSYLRDHAPMAIEGQGGDSTTYKVACRLCDWGISQAVATDLMIQHWNETKALPPWQPAELEAKVANAYAYAQNQIGARSPSVQFEGIDIPLDIVGTPPNATPPVDADKVHFGRIRPLDQIPARPWVMAPYLLRRHWTSLVAPGATGKSTLILWWAICIATGTPFLDHPVLIPGKVMLFSHEDDRDEMERRVHAFCLTHGLDPMAAMANIAMLPGDEIRLKLATGRDSAINMPAIMALATRCRREGVVAIFIDPMTGIHESDENDNTGMAKVAEGMMLLAHEANAAGLIVRHTRKGFSGEKITSAGDVDAARGAGSLKDSFRINLTLSEPSDDDVKGLGIPMTDRGDYVRLDGSKQNLTRKSRDPVWFKRKGVSLANGDSAVVLESVNIRNESVAYRNTTLGALEAWLDEMDTMSISVYGAATLMRERDPLWAKKDHRSLEAILKQLLAEPWQNVKGGLMRIRFEAPKTGRRDPVAMICLE